MAYRLLIADDEPDIIQLLKDFLEIQGYEVIIASNGVQVLEKLAKNPDLILLDVNMPGLDGFEVCRRIRNYVSCPIVFLTAKVEEQDRINGLNLGGDDYIMKPFSIDELGARVEAHLRREERKKQNTPVNMAGGLALYYSERCAYYENHMLNFTKTEFDIVELLSMHQGQVFSKEQVYVQVRGMDGSADSNIVMEHIRRIRTKIAAYTDKAYIETVWGVGYKWIG